MFSKSSICFSLIFQNFCSAFSNDQDWLIASGFLLTAISSIPTQKQVSYRLKDAQHLRIAYSPVHYCWFLQLRLWTQGIKEQLKSQCATWTLGDMGALGDMAYPHAISSHTLIVCSLSLIYSSLEEKGSIVICICTSTYITKIRASSLSWVSLQTVNLIIMTALGSNTNVEIETWRSHRVSGRSRIYTKISSIRALRQGALLHDGYRPLN